MCSRWCWYWIILCANLDSSSAKNAQKAKRATSLPYGAIRRMKELSLFMGSRSQVGSYGHEINNIAILLLEAVRPIEYLSVLSINLD
jgi:hypothetical protein